MEIESDSEISAISPLEGVISGLFKRVYQIALNMDAKKFREAHQDYEHRRNDLQEFLVELENNPLGFPMDEIKALQQSVDLLEQQLDMIGLYLDMVVHAPQMVAESIDVYLKNADSIPDDMIERELAKIKNSTLRQGLLENLKNTKYKEEYKAEYKIAEYLQHFSLTEIRKTINLLNQYFQETIKNPEKNRCYKNLLYFLHENNASWIPIGEEIYSDIFLHGELTTDSEVNNIMENSNIRNHEKDKNKDSGQLKHIERKVAAFELEVVPDKKKSERLREIQGLKSELNKIDDNSTLVSAEIIALRTKLEELYRILIPKKVGMGLFGGLKSTSLIMA